MKISKQSEIFSRVHFGSLTHSTHLHVFNECLSSEAAFWIVPLTFFYLCWGYLCINHAYLLMIRLWVLMMSKIKARMHKSV